MAVFPDSGILTACVVLCKIQQYRVLNRLSQGSREGKALSNIPAFYGVLERIKNPFLLSDADVDSMDSLPPALYHTLHALSIPEISGL